MSAAPLDITLARRARYSEGAGIYRVLPRAVARPESMVELRDVLDACVRAGLTIVPRGAGSAMPGDNVGSGVVVDLSAFDRQHCLIDPRARLAWLSPGVTGGALEAAAGAHGLRLPPDPSSNRFATIGGMVSTNASGARSFKYGSIRRWVHGLTLTGPEGDLAMVRGEAPDPAHPIVRRFQQSARPALHKLRETIHERFPRVRKNSAGYALDHYLDSGDLIDLVIGAEGTLGLVTQVVVRLDPIPAMRGALRVALRSRADLGPAIEALRTQDPTTIELLDASFLALLDGPAITPERPGLFGESAAVLLADFEGADLDDVSVRAAAAVGQLSRFALDTRFAFDPMEVERLWQVRHGASPVIASITDGRRSLQVIEDGCVPPSRLAEYIEAVAASCRRHQVDVVMFGHAGDGHLHVNLLPDVSNPGWLDPVRAIYREVSDTVLALGGTPSGEHGVGRLRTGLLAPLYGDDIIASFAAVKAAFDPNGLFNPGVIVAGAGQPFDELKVGDDAAALPEGTAEYLRAVETGARWGPGRWIGD